MIKKLICILIMLVIAHFSLMAGKSLAVAETGWEIKITAKINKAENKLVLGQNPEALDGKDGRYDVPALLAGDIRAYFELEGGQYWKDIKQACHASCQKLWPLVIESDLVNQRVDLAWDFSDISENIRILLKDKVGGKVLLDMRKAPGYSYENMGKRELVVEAETW